MKSFNLENHPKIQSGFTIPESYFENLSQELLDKINREEKPVVSIFTRHKKWFMAVAAVLILGIMVPFLNNFRGNTINVDETTIENYLAQSNISQYELVNLLDENDIDALESELSQDNSTVESFLIYDGNLENHLLD